MYKKSIKEEVNMKKGEQFPEWALWKALITYDANKDSNEKKQKNRIVLFK